MKDTKSLQDLLEKYIYFVLTLSSKTTFLTIVARYS